MCKRDILWLGARREMIRILDWIQLDIFGPNHSGWGRKEKRAPIYSMNIVQLGVSDAFITYTWNCIQYRLSRCVRVILIPHVVGHHISLIFWGAEMSLVFTRNNRAWLEVRPSITQSIWMFHHHSIIRVILSHTLGSSVFCNSHDIYITGSFMCFFPCLPLEPEIVIYMSQSYYCHCGSDDCDHSDIGEDPAGA